MSRMKPTMKHLLLFLPLILVIVIKESYASSDENHATLLANADESSHVKSNLDQSEYPSLDRLFDSDRTEPGSDTLISNDLKNSTSSDDVSETSNNEQIVPESTELSPSDEHTITKIMNSSSESSSSTSILNNTAVNDAGNENSRDVPKGAEETEATNTGMNEHSEVSHIPTDTLSKRILISSVPNVDPEPINLDKVPDVRLDSWRPLWLDQQMSSLDIKPTIRFPSITIPHNSYIESSLQAKPEILENYSVSKEPVTAYYFDLSSVIPSIQVGPLYDPSYLINAQTRNTPVAVHPTAEFGNHNLPHDFEDHDYIHTTINDDNYFTSEREPVAIEPTPTLPAIEESSHLRDQDLVHNVQDYDLKQTVPDQEDTSSMLGADSVTITSLYNKTTDELQNSTPAYTLGNSTDFKFTQNEPILPNNSTNFYDVTLPSILSSERPLDSQNSTGDLNDSNNQSFFNASLYKLPISPNDLPLPISVANKMKTRADVNINPMQRVSRIPLWKRLTQTNSQNDNISPTQTVDYHNFSDVTSNTFSSPSHILFENDLPIGILSPGIFIYPNQYFEEQPDNYSDADIYGDEVGFVTSTPRLESSLQSTTHSDNESIFSSVHVDNETENDLSHNLNHSLNSQSILTSSIVGTSNVDTVTSSVYQSIVPLVSSIDSFIDSFNWPHDSHESTVDLPSETYTSETSSNIFVDVHSVDSIFTPMFTKTRVTTQTSFTEEVVNTALITNTKNAQFEPAHTAQTHLLNNDTNRTSIKSAVNIAELDVSSPDYKDVSKSPAVDNPIINEINNIPLYNISDNKDSNYNFEENSLGLPSLFHNLDPSLKDVFKNSSVKFTESESPMNVSADISYYDDEYLDYGNNRTHFLSFVNDTVEGVEMQDGLHEIFTPDKDDVSDVNFTNHIKDVTNITTTSTTEKSSTSTTESTTTTSSTTTSTSSTTTASTTTTPTTTTTTPTTTSSTTRSTTTTRAKFTTPRNIPEDLEMLFPFNRSSIFNDTLYTDYMPDINATKKDISSSVVVVVSKNGGNEPELSLIKMHKNGTNTTHSTPYIKAAVSYDVFEFCRHHKNIKNLLKQWINAHLSNISRGNAFEIEIFHQPDCENLYLHNDESEEQNPSSHENKTTLFFYVKENGQISPNSTLHYPRNPTNLEITQELDYLKEKILHLELMNASSTEERLFEEAAVGTSIVVIVVVTTLLIILLIGAILAFFVIKRRRAAETMSGRRCTPAANDAYSLDSVSVFYHSLRRKSKKRASNKSLKSYLNQGFDDPNMPSRPLNFAKLTHFISDNEAIYDEFSNIPSVVPKYDEMPKGVEEKNRYANVIPVPETRILLDGSKSTPSTQYINANSIHGPRGELRYYIATQAPLDNTVADFWQMVWEQESKVIVMLTDFVEKGIDKCADYLPPSETLDCHRVYGEFQITLKSRDMREKYIVSLLQIKNLENNLVREVAHMWYTGWPQTGVPTEEKLFISYIFDVRTTRKQLRAKGPIIVHCSPGTGRTGTYIACDLCMRQFDEQKVIDIPKTVFRIRRERAGAVQTKEQYSFIYRVVNLYAAKLTTGNLDSF